ncbi:hypothetical protein EJ07DRAFT_64580, partial [Lizonia empirigonia]
PDHGTLLEIKKTDFARERSLYACKYCIRLRHKYHFADSMLKKKYRREGASPHKRFCVDCGFVTTWL